MVDGSVMYFSWMHYACSFRWVWMSLVLLGISDQYQETGME